VVDDFVGRRRAPLAEVLGGVGITDQCRVVGPDDRCVRCGPDAFIGLCPGDDQVPYRALGKHGLQLGVLEGIGVALVDDRLRFLLGEFGNVAPAVAAFG
jgi:hypothetical protein